MALWIWFLIGFVLASASRSRTDARYAAGQAQSTAQRKLPSFLQGTFFLAFLVAGTVSLIQLVL